MYVLYATINSTVLKLARSCNIHSPNTIADNSPSISQITAQTPAVLTSLDTKGGEEVLLTGDDFGTFNDAIQVSYGHDGSSFVSSCTIETPHTLLKCVTIAGIGAGLRFLAEVEGQASGLSGTTISYHAPVWAQPGDALRGQEGTNPREFQTVGGEVIFLYGNFFGPPQIGVEMTVSLDKCKRNELH